MSLRLLALIVSIPLTVIALFVILNNQTFLDAINEYSNNICNSTPNKIFQYNDILCLIVKDTPLLLTVIGIMMLAIEILVAIYMVNKESTKGIIS